MWMLWLPFSEALIGWRPGPLANEDKIHGIEEVLLNIVFFYISEVFFPDPVNPM